MSVIKFRAWHNDSKLMFDVKAIAFQKKQLVVKWHGAERAIDIKDFTLMQFTGLYDKNGKEIFEGDIYTTGGNSKYIVFYKTGCFCGGEDYELSVPIGMDKDSDDEWIFENCTWLTIIGNIHEHAHLLQGIK